MKKKNPHGCWVINSQVKGIAEIQQSLFLDFR